MIFFNSPVLFLAFDHVTDHKRQFITCLKVYVIYLLRTQIQSSTMMRSNSRYISLLTAQYNLLLLQFVDNDMLEPSRNKPTRQLIFDEELIKDIHFNSACKRNSVCNLRYHRLLVGLPQATSINQSGYW